MKRRDFITLLGGAAAAWPVAVRAQQSAMPVIGMLGSGWMESAAYTRAALRKGLSEAGYVENQNVAIEYRYAEGQFERLPWLAADLVQRGVSVIVATPRTEIAAKSATETIPIVFMSGTDPVRAGLVTSLSRPTENITGVTILAHDLETKRIGILRELVPGLQVMAVLEETNHPEAPFRRQQVQLAAGNLGIPIRVVSTADERDFDAVFASLKREGIGALLVGVSIYFANMRERLAAAASVHKIPTMYEFRQFAEAGGLISYGASIPDAYRQVGAYVGKILKGAKPADLPVVQPTKFELVINLKTAKALGIEIPPTLLARADEVIE
jgi:putative tryptophan/tyrosine transport system substrate-binding protein